MNKRFLIIFAVIVAAFIGLVMFNKKDDGANDTGTVQPSNYIKGEGASGVTLIEYGDFQCSGCYTYEPLVKQVVEKYKDQIYFQFRHYPLVSLHRNAMAAHRAAEAAGHQDKFWEMHDKLYETQDPTGKTGWAASGNPSSFFEIFAKELGLDLEKYKADVGSTEVQAVINADLREGQALKISSTPTFVINGKKVEDNPRDLESFYKLIDEAIAKSSDQ